MNADCRLLSPGLVACIFLAYTESVRTSDGPVPDIREFEWDDGNSEKSWKNHCVRPAECEELFGERPLLLSEDLAHSNSEPRYLALGRTRAGRRLLVAFTVRAGRLRVISARDMSRKERSAYDAARKEDARKAPTRDPGLR